MPSAKTSVKKKSAPIPYPQINKLLNKLIEEIPDFEFEIFDTVTSTTLSSLSNAFNEGFLECRPFFDLDDEEMDEYTFATEFKSDEPCFDILVDDILYSCVDQSNLDDYHAQDPDGMDELRDNLKKGLQEIHKTWKANQKNEQKKQAKDGGVIERATETVKSDVKTVSVRIAARQVTKNLVMPLATRFAQSLGKNDDTTRSNIADFLMTDIGQGMISVVASLGIKMAPLPENMRNFAEALGDEMRIQGEVAIAEPMVDMVVAPVREMLTGKFLGIGALPPPPGTKQVKAGIPVPEEMLVEKVLVNRSA